MKKLFILFLSCAFFTVKSQIEQEKAAQDNHVQTTVNYQFTTIVDLETTSVKDQSKSSTCWSFAGVSFLESEIIRMQKHRIDLSEMYVVRMAYLAKAEKYLRMHGKIAFPEGGETADVLYVLKNFGAIPEEAYSGLINGEKKHNHHKLQKALKSYLDELILKEEITAEWQANFKNILDLYLGELPNSFDFQGKNYTPRTFADEIVQLNAEDYISITSFTHHPFYNAFALEVPDNWMWDFSFNLPLDEMMLIAENALTHGFSVAWAADNSEDGFSSHNGLAILPAKPWNEMTKEELKDVFSGPHQKLIVTQNMRQEAFNAYKTTDDHAMHFTGLAKDQQGNLFFIAKNSWGAKKNSYREGYLYATDAYVRAKTISLLMHKNALSKPLRRKLAI